MNCPKCSAVNDDQNLFCVNCGIHFQSADSGKTAVPPTQNFNQYVQNQEEESPQSMETVLHPVYKTAPSAENAPPISYDDATPKKSRKGLILALSGVGVLGLLAVVAAAAIYLYNKQLENAEVLPDHLGMFLQSRDRKRVDELAKQDFTNALEGKDNLLKNEALPVLENYANAIMYLDARDASLNDLKLVQLDSIKESGKLKQVEFQAVPVEGKPDMKRLRMPNGLANGKYAFVLFEGYLDEGKHKFWAFQVRDAGKSDNNDIAKEISISLKSPPTTETAKNDSTEEKAKTDGQNAQETVTEPVNKSTPKKDTAVAPPTGSLVAFCNSSNVVMRGSPSLNGKKIGALQTRQRVYILQYSRNEDYWNGVYGNWAYVQTESGKRGWVFSPLLSY